MPTCEWPAPAPSRPAAELASEEERGDYFAGLRVGSPQVRAVLPGSGMRALRLVVRRVRPPVRTGPFTHGEGARVIILGIILIVIGLLVPGLAVLNTIGVLLLVVGVILWILGSMGRAVGGRKHFY
jgi:Family of unknown function (DUF6131)